MNHNKKNISNGFRLPCGYLAAGGILAMLFCQVSSRPLLMASIGAFLVLFALLWAVCRHECKDIRHHWLWW